MKIILAMLLLISFQGDNKLSIEKTWTRVSAEGTNTAFFFDVVNNSDKPDTLYNVESTVAEITEIHETYKVDGKMGMRKIPYVVIPPKSTFNFKPRSYHIMLIGLNNDVNANDVVELTVYFKQAGKMVLKGIARTM
jgi:periplasmic copper chaperone A